jgi:GNAT superfamily N-acetyltransferase
MPSLHIREYDHARDAAAFRALNYQTFRDSIPADEAMEDGEFRRHYAWLVSQFSPEDKARNAVFVAEVDGRYAGHIWLGTQTDFFTRRVDPWVFDLSVLASFRHQGVARALHDHAVAWLRKRGSRLLGLQVMAHNQAAMHMYVSLGYKPRAHTLKLKL